MARRNQAGHRLSQSGDLAHQRRLLASDFIAENELPPLLAAAQEEGAVIIPTILKHCAFEDSELSQFQAVEQAQPLIDFSEGKREEVWAKVARLVKEALKTAEAHAKRADPA